MITGAIRSYIHTPIPIIVHRMQLSERIHGVDRNARNSVLIPIF